MFAIYTVWINLASALMPGLGEVIIRRAGFHPLFGVAALALAAGLAALPLGHGALRLVLVGLACGAAHGVVMPVLSALLLIGMSRDRRGWGVAPFAAAYDLGVVLATGVLGALAEWIGYRGIFVVVAAVMVLGVGTAHVWGQR